MGKKKNKKTEVTADELMEAAKGVNLEDDFWGNEPDAEKVFDNKVEVAKKYTGKPLQEIAQAIRDKQLSREACDEVLKDLKLDHRLKARMFAAVNAVEAENKIKELAPDHGNVTVIPYKEKGENGYQYYVACDSEAKAVEISKKLEQHGISSQSGWSKFVAQHLQPKQGGEKKDYHDKYGVILTPDNVLKLKKAEKEKPINPRPMAKKTKQELESELERITKKGGKATNQEANLTYQINNELRNRELQPKERQNPVGKEGAKEQGNSEPQQVSGGDPLSTAPVDKKKEDFKEYLNDIGGTYGHLSWTYLKDVVNERNVNTGRAKNI